MPHREHDSSEPKPILAEGALRAEQDVVDWVYRTPEPPPERELTSAYPVYNLTMSPALARRRDEPEPQDDVPLELIEEARPRRPSPRPRQPTWAGIAIAASLGTITAVGLAAILVAVMTTWTSLTP